MKKARGGEIKGCAAPFALGPEAVPAEQGPAWWGEAGGAEGRGGADRSR